MSQTRPAKHVASRPSLDQNGELWAKILGIVKARNVERKWKQASVRKLNELMHATLHRRACYMVEVAGRTGGGSIVVDVGCNPGCEWISNTPHALQKWQLARSRYWVMTVTCIIELLEGPQPLWCWRCYQRNCAARGIPPLVLQRSEAGMQSLFLHMLALKGVLHPQASAASCRCALLQAMMQ